MDKLKMQTPNLSQENIEKIAKIFPQAITEKEYENGKTKKAIDFDILKQILEEDLVEGGDERYRLDWPGKKASILKANTPITNKTLRPVKEESEDFDNTENLYIEGDNFQVLKLLQESYLNKIKMIYIDPPYNTGKDFVYKDNFTQDKNEYNEEVGAVDDEGNKLFKNTSTNGRFHSDWLSMMYERLTIARDLLREDGVIFISIDDNEVANLRKICDEIFGEENFLGQFCVKVNTKMQKYKPAIGTEHEYIMVFSKNSGCRLNYIESENYKKVINNFDKYKLLSEIPKTKSELKSIIDLNIIFKENPGLKNYKYKDNYGIFRGDNLNMTHGKGGFFKVYPEKGLDSLIPPKHGWCHKDKFLRSGLFVEGKDGNLYFKNIQDVESFGNKKSYSFLLYDNKNITQSKTYLDSKTIFSSIILGFQGSDDLYLEKLFGFKIFDFPKIVNLIKKLINFGSMKNDIILDFFSGSATTAHAVMQLNAEDGGSRKYIMVQLPEEIDEKSEAYKAGYKNICEIGKERIRRAAKKIKEDNKDKDLSNVDFGFRVFKLDSTNMKDVYYTPAKISQSLLSSLESNIKEDRSPEDLLIQVMLDLGLKLSYKIESREILNHKVFFVEKNSLVACFDENINFEIVDEIANVKPLKVVFRDACFKDDKDRINVEERFKRLSPETSIKVI